MPRRRSQGCRETMTVGDQAVRSRTDPRPCYESFWNCAAISDFLLLTTREYLIRDWGGEKIGSEEV